MRKRNIKPIITGAQEKYALFPRRIVFGFHPIKVYRRVGVKRSPTSVKIFSPLFFFFVLVPRFLHAFINGRHDDVWGDNTAEREPQYFISALVL